MNYIVTFENYTINEGGTEFIDAMRSGVVNNLMSRLKNWLSNQSPEVKEALKQFSQYLATQPAALQKLGSTIDLMPNNQKDMLSTFVKSIDSADASEIEQSVTESLYYSMNEAGTEMIDAMRSIGNIPLELVKNVISIIGKITGATSLALKLSSSLMDLFRGAMNFAGSRLGSILSEMDYAGSVALIVGMVITALSFVFGQSNN